MHTQTDTTLVSIDDRQEAGGFTLELVLVLEATRRTVGQIGRAHV